MESVFLLMEFRKVDSTPSGVAHNAHSWGQDTFRLYEGVSMDLFFTVMYNSLPLSLLEKKQNKMLWCDRTFGGEYSNGVSSYDTSHIVP